MCLEQIFLISESIHFFFIFSSDQFHKLWLKSVHHNMMLTTVYCQFSQDVKIFLLVIRPNFLIDYRTESYDCWSDINYVLTHWVIGRSLVDVLVEVNEKLRVVGEEFQVLAIFPAQSHHKFIQHKQNQKQITSANNNQLKLKI